jgi:hypothetical protein
MLAKRKAVGIASRLFVILINDVAHVVSAIIAMNIAINIATNMCVAVTMKAMKWKIQN